MLHAIAGETNENSIKNAFDMYLRDDGRNTGDRFRNKNNCDLLLITDPLTRACPYYMHVRTH